LNLCPGLFISPDFGLNTNSVIEAEQFDQGCDRNSPTAIDTEFNGDYISLLGGYTILAGLDVTPATKFCGVYTDGIIAPQFPGASCK
jgi:hypothetical protein